MVNIYENIIEEFNKQNCKLLTTKEEYIDILKNTKNVYRLNYIASCGHTHIVFYNVFKSRGTGIVCPSCKNKKIGYDKKEKMKNNEMSKTSTIEQECKFINQIQLFLKNDFEIIKAFDGCNIDIIFKPKNIIDDKWVGIQVKTTNVRHLTYSFHINNIYKNCLLLFYCCEDETMWLIPENIIDNQKKVSIGYNKSKYNIYKICKDNLINKLNEFYNKTTNFEFDKLNTPTCIYQQREQLFRKYREEKIKFLDFGYDNIEGTVYDFKINNFKVQEKVAKISDKENRYIFFLCKNNGSSNKIQYNIGDNDFYWLNCDNKETFFVIPETKLIEKGFIGNKIENNNKQTLKITVKKELHKKSAWLQDYMFDYENIDKDRLLFLLKN
jgi:hypothetical protein